MDAALRDLRPVAAAPASAKRKRAVSSAAADGDQWLAANAAHFVRPAPTPSPGLRGIYNMGATCFMNAVLQVRNYFLGDRHNARRCAHARGYRGDCLGCHMDDFVAGMYAEPLLAGGAKPPRVPHQLLYAVWQFASHLSGYEQQDAHEFLVALLDGLHTHTTAGAGAAPAADACACACVAHLAFAGALRSDVRCEACGSVSTTRDPILDVSLSLSAALDVEGCLRAYTRAERLSPDERVRCQQCAARQDCTKQLSIERLPSTLVIHLKRFNPVSRVKDDRHVSFPLELDMAPFSLAGGVRRLFAVVVHQGTLTSGHYTSYVCPCSSSASADWFRCDDEHVTLATEGDVLAAQAYLLFYG